MSYQRKVGNNNSNNNNGNINKNNNRYKLKMPALSPVKKGRLGLGGSRMGTKKQDSKSGKTVFMATLR
jgi:hypothetical protein